MTLTENPQWNIWRIKSKYARALFTVFIVTPLLLVVTTITAFLALIVGAAHGAKYAWYIFSEVVLVDNTWIGYWRAITLRGKP